MRLLGFELGKVWGRRSFLLSVCVLLAVNGFLLWYTNLPDGEEPGLYAYRAFGEEIAGMTEEEKGQYVTEYKETMEGVRFVEEVTMLRGMSGEMGEALAAQMLEASPGMFEAWYDTYQSGGYLRFTDSLWQEERLARELYDEWQRCAEYGEYLQAVQENRTALKGIGIFGGTAGDSFSARNVEKSARDYQRLTGEGIRWMPGKAVTSSLENRWTDLFLLLSVAFFVGYLILEEKEKRLFYITRCARKGILPDVWARLGALFLHCLAAAGLFYGENLAFYGRAAGLGDLSARLQSLAAYRESCLEISVRQFILLSVATKGLALFGFGVVIAAACLLSSGFFLPYIVGGLWYGGSYALYAAIPAGSKGAAFKYLNLAGSLQTQKLYGAYLNLNLFGRPMSRLALTLGLLGLIILTGVSLCLLLFARGERLELVRGRFLWTLPFRPHGNAFLHEGTKVMATNRAAVLLLLFGALIGYRDLSRQYSLSAQEQYYQDIMLALEGELTQEKEELVLAEEARYREAFREIQRIEELVAAGEIGERVGEDMKSPWYAVTAFYPAFSRVWQQYEDIHENGGAFLYDTGYLYLFGIRGGEFRVDLLLLTGGMILAFGDVMAMEDRKGAWNLLGATLRGRRRIMADKAIVCAVAAALFSLVPFLCRMINIQGAFPLRGLSFSATAIPCFRKLPAWLPAGGLVMITALWQSLVAVAAALVVLLLSYWRKDSLQAYFFGVAVLLVPQVLGLLGLSFADWLSLYPLYRWTAGA